MTNYHLFYVSVYLSRSHWVIMVSAGMSCVKCLLFCFNLLFAVSFCGLIYEYFNFINIFIVIRNISSNNWGHCSYCLFTLLKLCVSKLSVSTFSINWRWCIHFCGSFLWMLWYSKRKLLYDHNSKWKVTRFHSSINVILFLIFSVFNSFIDYTYRWIISWNSGLH